MTLNQYLYEQWQSRVDAQYLYRGMSAKDLTDPLDPAFDPFAEYRPELYRLIKALLRAVDAGFEFVIRHDYSGYEFPLRNILIWSQGDLDNPGLDFTSVYDHACEYAMNFQGSQLKHNFKYILEHLAGSRDVPVLRETLTDEDWDLARQVRERIVREDAHHRMIVLWVRRSCQAFEADPPLSLLCGSFAFFRRRVLDVIAERRLPHSARSVEAVLPPADHAFQLRLPNPLRLADVERIEER